MLAAGSVVISGASFDPELIRSHSTPSQTYIPFVLIAKPRSPVVFPELGNAAMFAYETGVADVPSVPAGPVCCGDAGTH